jgi:hypothetical protein
VQRCTFGEDGEAQFAERFASASFMLSRNDACRSKFQVNTISS